MSRRMNYAALILDAISEVIENNDLKEDFEDENEENLTEFLHAMANIVPTNFYNQVADEKLSNLDFNHVANKLCFQFGRQKD